VQHRGTTAHRERVLRDELRRFSQLAQKPRGRRWRNSTIPVRGFATVATRIE
jgi:hypothetical protein